eukprot:3443593-Amphidinium_carterae.1
MYAQGTTEEERSRGFKTPCTRFRAMRVTCCLNAASGSGVATLVYCRVNAVLLHVDARQSRISIDVVFVAVAVA